MRVTRFDPVHPHTSSVAATVNTPTAADAFESIAFDNAGNYYLGGMAPQAESALDPVQPHGFIFKYSSSHTLVATYSVPNERGADWIDIGEDPRTLYYTSEDTKIHVLRPAQSDGETDFYEEIQIATIEGTPIGGRTYAVRLLPALPGDLSLKPSGFLVAMDWRIRRLNAEGRYVQEYTFDNNAGSFFALNLTPDGQSFWTATFAHGDPDYRDYCPGGIRPGRLGAGSRLELQLLRPPASAGGAARQVSHRHRGDHDRSDRHRR